MVKEKIKYVKVNEEKFKIAINDVKSVENFLRGLAVLAEREDKYPITSQATKLSNAIQWLHNWGDEEEIEEETEK